MWRGGLTANGTFTFATKLNAGTAFNIIPRTVKLTGTVTALRPSLMPLLR